MKNVAAALIALVFCSRLGGADAYQDEIGIYFDAACAQREAVVAPGYTQDACLVLQRMTGPQLAAFACRMETTGGAFFGNWWSLIGLYADGPPVWELAAWTPIARTDVLPLVHLQFTIMTSDEIRIFLRPIEAYSPTIAYYWAEITDTALLGPVAMTPSSGDWEDPVAYINRTAVPVEAGTWGSVKRLFLP